ncbi:MAG: GGDEF domain-containing protein [Oceanococcus sp.]
MQNLQSIGCGRRRVDPTAELREFDPLTGLATRPLFRMRLDEQWEKSRLQHRPLGLLMIQLCDYRRFRAEHSKQDVRLALAAIGQEISHACFRRADFAARIRLDEIAAVLTDADEEGAREVANRLAENIPALNIRLSERVGDVLTVNIGAVAETPGPSHFASSLLMRGDEALERARDLGPGQVCGSHH